MENNQQVERIKTNNAPTTSNTKIVSILLSILVLCAIGYLGYNNYRLTKSLEKYVLSPSTPQPTPTSLVTPTTTPTPTTLATTTPIPSQAPADKWRDAKYGGIFSYSHPRDWHVAELWPETGSSPIRLAMDKKPITTAPMGGPSSIFNFYIYNGQANPDTKLNELKSQFKPQDFTDIKTETINTANGPVLYQTGKMAGEYMQGTKVENYLFTIKGANSDSLNVQVIQGTLYGGDKELSDMFRYVVLSFKPL